MRSLLVLAVLAAGSTPAVASPSAVTTLAADGGRVAFASAPTRTDCDRVRLWTPPARTTLRLGTPRPCGDAVSTGRGLAALSIAGGRALWLTYAGGNIREWQLWTATTTAPAPRQLRFIPRDVDDAPPLVLGDGDADLLPYALDRTVIALRANGSRAFAWTAPARPVALSARGGHVAVALAGGTVTVLDRAGRVIGTQSFAGEISAVRLAGSTIVVQHGRTLDTGTRTWALPRTARLEDAEGDLAAWVDGTAVHLVRLGAGGGETVLRLAAPAHAQIEGARLVLSAGRTVSSRPLPRVP